MSPESTEKSFLLKAAAFTADVKGLERFSADPRGIKGHGLMNAVHSRGGDHYRGEPMIELTGDEAPAIKRVGNPDAAHRLKEQGKGALVNYADQATDEPRLCYGTMAPTKRFCRHATSKARRACDR